MKKVSIIVSIIFLIAVSFFLGYKFGTSPDAEVKEPLTSKFNLLDKPLEKYSIENLSEGEVPVGKIKIKENFDNANNDKFDSYIFEFTFSPDLSDKNLKKTTGLLNIPKETGNPPLVIMIRGYVDQTIYQTGVGSKNASFYLAENGFATIALDYLGYAGSDSESGNIFESRFQTYTATLSLIKTLKKLDSHPELLLAQASVSDSDQLTNALINHSSLFIWAHSNGGQIALTTLSVLKEAIPTVLWAPVTKPFPYSVLYYTDESADGGKLIRDKLSDFEENYDVDKYSFTQHLDSITAPILLQQGTADDAIPLDWSTGFVTKMKSLEKEITYKTYPGSDHNMRPAWDEAIEEDLKFYKNYLER